MQINEKYAKDLANLNRQYLVLAREMARDNEDLAFNALGIPTIIRKIISGLTLEEIDRLAGELPVLQYGMRINERHYSRFADAVKAYIADPDVPLGLIAAAQVVTDIES